MLADDLLKVDIAYNKLKEDIISIKLRPLAQLKIKWLNENYGFGTTPLREALNRLESENFVTLTPNIGFVVNDVSIDELIDLLQTRSLIRLHLLKESMQCGDMEWESEVVSTHYRLSREKSPASENYSFEEYVSWVHAYDAFNDALISAHQSVWFSRFNQKLTEHIRRQGRALLIIMPDSEQHDFFTAMRKSQSLRGLYEIEIYTEMKDAVLNRNFDEIKSLFNKNTDLVIAAYSEMYGIINSETKILLHTCAANEVLC